jgi:hypothetical protein
MSSDGIEPKALTNEQFVEKGSVPASHDAQTAINQNLEAK